MERPASAEDLLHAWLDPLRLPAGGGEEILFAPLGSSALVAGPRRSRVLLGCEGFATLDQHAARLAAQGAGAPDEVRAELGALAGAGLLVSAAELLKRLGDPVPDPCAHPRVPALGIPTRERVPELREALAGYAGNALAHGRSLEYVVADDARDAATRAETRAAVAEIGERLGVPVSYLGREEKDRYGVLLADHAGVPRSLTEWALGNPEGCRTTYGANLNALLFHGAGELMVQVDDDTRCRIAPAPGQLPGLALTSRSDPTELWFPGPGAPDLPERVVVDHDYAGLHEQLLGRRVADCVAEARRQGLALDSASGAFFRRLGGGGGRVACTQTGAAGDSGTGSAWHLLLLDDPSRARLLGAEALYRHAFTGRRVVRVVPRASVTDGSFIMSMSIGLDLSRLVPPFFPVQRNADGLFGALLHAAFPRAAMGFVPWVVEHVPALPRSLPFPAFFASLGRTPCVDLLCVLVSSMGVEADPEDPARNLRALGETLGRWAALPPADFEEIVRIQVLRVRSLDLELLDLVLSRHRGAPAFWARDVERAAAAVRAALTEPWLSAPADLVEDFGDEAGRALFRRLCRDFASLLRAWPDLFAAAVELRGRGVRPGVRVSP